jgi:hypothetical protein
MGVTYGVHLEVDKLSASKCDDDLAHVDGAAHDGFLAGRLPLVDTLVGANVSDAVGVDLHEGVIAELRAGECGGGAQETRVRHFLDRLTDAQYQGGVDERHDNVRVKVVCKPTPDNTHA